MAKGSGKSDPSPVIGILLGLGSIIGGFMVEGGKPIELVGISALIIIVGGTMATVIGSFSVKEALNMGKYFKEAMQGQRKPDQAIFEYIEGLSEKSRKEGLLSLEDSIESIEDPFLRKGIRLAIDGTDSESLADILEGDIEIFESRQKAKAAVFEAAGGFAPTIGIIGTVMGLVLVLSELGGDAAHLGESIAAAFIATLYGIGFANIVFLPLANNLKNKLKSEIEYRHMMVTAILCLQAGDTTMLVEAKLSGYVEGEGKKDGAQA